MDVSRMVLTFDEEFTASSLDPKWRTALGWNNGECRNQPPYEGQYYCDPNVPYASSGTPTINPFTFTGKSLIITAAPSTDMTATRNLPYSSGCLTTWDTFGQLFGYWEMRCKFSGLGKDSGFWPAFWMMPFNITWPWEIDAFEIFCGKNTHNEGGNFQMHTGLVGGTSSAHYGLDAQWNTVPNDPLDGNFHTYGLDWQDDYISWYMDDALVIKAATPKQFTTPGYVIANLAVGLAGAWPGAPAAGTSCTMEIDHIRIFSRFYDATPCAFAGASAADGVDTTPCGALSTTGPIRDGSAMITASVATHNTPTYTSLPPAQFEVLLDGVAVTGPLQAAANHDTGAWAAEALPPLPLFGARTLGIKLLNPFYAPPYGKTLFIQSVIYADAAHSYSGTLTAANLAPNQPKGVTANADGSVSIGAGVIATFVLPTI